MTEIPAEDGVYSDLPEGVYHSDRNSLSSSGARQLLPPSCPAIFREQQLHRPESKPQFDFGHAAHKLILGKGQEIVSIPHEDWRTKQAKELRDQAYADGKTPLLERDVKTAEAMARKVLEHPRAEALLSAGDAEISGYWHDETGVRLRYRTDWLHPGQQRIIAVDYKTSSSAHPKHFAKAAADYGYHQQAAWYLDGLAATGVSDDAAFLFIVQSKTPPHPVSVIELNQRAIELGRALNRQAINLYAECVANDHWPDYGHNIHLIELPTWAVYQQESILA